MRYRLDNKWLFEGRYIYTIVGRNTDINYGGDILLENSERNGDYGINMHQGAKSKISNFSIDVSYELFYNFQIHASYMSRKDNNDQLQNFENQVFTLGLKYNFHQNRVDY